MARGISESENVQFPESLRKLRKLSSIVVHAFSQTGLGKRDSPPANNRNRNSEYLPQRRQDRKGRRKHLKIFRKNNCLFPQNLASLRLCGRHIRIREYSITGKFTQAARYDKHVGVSFWIVVRRAEGLFKMIASFDFLAAPAHLSAVAQAGRQAGGPPR